MKVNKLDKEVSTKLFWDIVLNKKHIEIFDSHYIQYKDIITIDYLNSFFEKQGKNDVLDILNIMRYHISDLFLFLKKESENSNQLLDNESKENYILVLYLVFFFGIAFLNGENKSESLNLGLSNDYGYLVLVKNHEIVNILNQKDCILSQSGDAPFFLVNLQKFEL